MFRDMGTLHRVKFGELYTMTPLKLLNTLSWILYSQKMTGETLELRSDKRKPRENRQRKEREKRVNREKERKRERKERKVEKKKEKKNSIYWQKCSKSQQLGGGSLVGNYQYKSSCRS